MAWEIPSGSFSVEPLKLGFQPWPKQEDSKPVIEPAWRSDENLKRQFGVALAKSPKNAFDAALNVFGADTNAALWASFNWLHDPLVVASRDTYAQNIELSEKLLDKDAFAAKMLKMADERDPTGRFFLLEGKDRIAILKLYAEVQGFTGKLSIDASTNNFTNNELKLVLVPAPEKETKVIEAEPEELSAPILPLNLKLVSGSR